MSFREKSPRRVDEENKTDEDLGDALAVCHRCDECREMINYESWAERQDAMLECGHTFCMKCFRHSIQAEHSLDKCPVKRLKCPFPKWYDSERPSKSEKKKIDISRKSYYSRSKLWNFEYKGRPIVVSLRRDATYGDLENRLALLLAVDLKTHFILINLPSSYNGGDANYFMQADDSLTNGPYEKDTKLRYLRHPRIAALSLEITEKKNPSSEPPSKESLQSPGTNSESKNKN
ncbi:hypothetical protein CRE_23934 [Caenorhabditis remanei]|uniref:RING-type domain-containing protein n=1 Tax=Caenorhabditis remanei TaxID=31234 RepID=E3MGI9_CAERE|nr:hypothetical protein CRE_23934 [Caenorhabditis remanei]